MKIKTLRKKIRRIELRIQEDPKKLVKLKRKLNAMVAIKAQKAQKKAAVRAVARQTLKPVTPAQKERGSLVPALLNTPATAKTASPAKRVKRKLNLSPERRAQLAAAMKARWAAKRAAATQGTSTGQDFLIARVPHAPDRGDR